MMDRAARAAALRGPAPLAAKVKAAAGKAKTRREKRGERRKAG